MDVILHIGAHRTGSTSFQHFLRDHAGALARHGIGYWGPGRTRKGLLHGIPDEPLSAAQARRGNGRVRLNLQSTAGRGVETLIVSDENMLGTPRCCLRAEELYPDAGMRIARLNAAFAPVRRVVLRVRSLDQWWASVMAFLIPRGASLPDPSRLKAIAGGARTWRHVITELGCACPETEIVVSPFERNSGRPDLMFREVTGSNWPLSRPVEDLRLNARPTLPHLRRMLEERGEDPGRLPMGTGRWHPFTEDEAARLREAYADDLFWLRAGADGLARLTEDPEPAKTAKTLIAGLDKRGYRHDRAARKLAPTR
ncbi:hypothetical protein [Pacificoceanicola onchidii]|uniref:hypothetical protein n=1 Tax=Pacificoceanicola onchidii TaxID=2562685 RepID=UPI0010A36D65|nr:hypothetical protein [Pacificoceanicola onchidii]